MQEADYSLTQQAFDAQSGRRNQGDEVLLVRFSMQPKHNKKESIKAGRPIYDDVEFISIMQPGNKDSVIERPVRESDKHRFPRHYAAFKNEQHQETHGTPLEQWPGVTRAQVEELKHYNVVTVEQLVGMTDANAQGFMGINELKTRAKAFLEAAEDNAAVEQLTAELEARDNKIDTLEATIADLSARLEALEEEDDA